MFDKWMLTSWSNAGMVVLSVLVMYGCIIAYTRIAGLRAFSKMSAFDYVVTLAFGSAVATTIVAAKPPVAQGLVALAALGGFQAIVALCRRAIRMHRVFDTRPLLLMAGSHILHENLRRARVTEYDIRQKLRESNVLNYDQVRAVVFETTGDIAVLHAADGDQQINPDLLQGVRGIESLAEHERRVTH